MSNNQQNKIGITIITGFLGAGKTSLLNQIIKTESSYKFAIIENEFSELGIDSELIQGIDKSSIIELSNGCICCTKNSELQETLNELLSSHFHFDHLIIETSGVANPDSIVQSVVANEYIKNIFYIDSVICIIDAENFDKNLSHSESIKQIAMADTIIVNKSDKINKDEYFKIKDKLLNINAICRIFPAIHSDYQNRNIISASLFNEADFKSSFKLFPINQHVDNKPITSSIGIELEGCFDKDKFMEWIEYFLHLNQSSIYRVKGILNFNNHSRKHIFQAVKVAFSVEEGNFWSKSDKRINRLAFIGHNLNKELILNELKLLMENNV